MHFEKKIKIKNLQDILPYPGKTNDDVYPGESYHWYDFSNGADVYSDQINEWMQECLDSVRRELLTGTGDKASSFVRSGNTAVFLFAFKEEDGYSLSFHVTKNYIAAEISGYDPLEDVEFVRVDNRDYRKEFEDKIDDLI